MENEVDVIFTDIKKKFEVFESEHKQAIGGKKAAATRARNATNDLAKMMKEYRKASIEAGKA